MSPSRVRSPAQQHPSLQAPAHPSVPPPGSHPAGSFPFCYSLWEANTTHQHIPGCPGGLDGILGSSGRQSWPSPGSPSHRWARQEAKSTRGLCSSSAPALAQLPGLYPAQQDLGSSPTSWTRAGDTTQTPVPPCPTPRPSTSPVAGIQGGHDTCAASLGGDTRPVSLPSFQPLQEMMHLSLAQAALGESWAHLSSHGSGWGALHSLAVPLPRL